MRYVFVLTLAGLILSFGACTKSSDDAKPESAANQSEPASEQTANLEEPEFVPLQALLDNQKQEWFRLTNHKDIELVENAVAELQAKNLTQNTLQHDDMAPDFELPDATGKMVKLSTLLKNGPVVLVWYRGGWCPYCNITLRSMQEQLAKITERDGTLVAISPELPDSSLSTKERNNLKFPVLSDKGNAVARKYGLVYTLPKNLASYYHSKFSLSAYYGTEKSELPMPATFVIDRKGMIRYAYSNADYRFRSEPREVVDILDQLKEGILK